MITSTIHMHMPIENYIVVVVVVSTMVPNMVAPASIYARIRLHK